MEERAQKAETEKPELEHIFETEGFDAGIAIVIDMMLAIKGVREATLLHMLEEDVPVSNKMDINEGDVYVGDLVQVWLESYFTTDQ